MAQAESLGRPPVTPAEYADRNAAPRPSASEDKSSIVAAAKDGFKQSARSVAEEQKAAGSARLDAFGRAVHDAAEALGKEIPQAAGYIHSVADHLQNASAELRERTVDDLVSRSGRFARQQPATTFTGSVLVGLALSRFLKSSSK